MSIMDRLDEIQDLVNAASDGPWDVTEGESSEGGRIYQVAAPVEPSGMGFDFLPILATGCTEADAEFMAAARTDLPALLDSARALDERVDSLRSEVVRLSLESKGWEDDFTKSEEALAKAEKTLGWLYGREDIMNTSECVVVATQAGKVIVRVNTKEHLTPDVAEDLARTLLVAPGSARRAPGEG